MDSELDIEFGPSRAVNGVTRRLADVGAAERDLGFTAEIDLETGLRRLVDWWRLEKDDLEVDALVAARTEAVTA
jgi:UDP-glucose 4-epimerase